MANCNKLFLDYSENLKISNTKQNNLKDSKEELRKRIREYFKKNHPEYKPEFYIQGSYKMKTTILTKDNECDLDDGIYFRREEGESGTILQTWVKNSLEGATSTAPEHRKKCIRVIYKGDYHIDFPVYYFAEGKNHPLLAVKGENTQESDPKEVVEWYQGEKDENGQLNRIVKYFKGWGDFITDEMPSGIAMTILAADNIQYDGRDDIALKNTLSKIQETLKNNFECIIPATPNDDLFENYDSKRKSDFLDNLSAFLKDAEEAVENEPNQLQSSKLWRNHLGENFPLGKDENVDKKEAALNGIAANILSSNAYTQKDGSINDSKEGIKNKPHRNFGGKK